MTPRTTSYKQFSLRGLIAWIANHVFWRVRGISRGTLAYHQYWLLAASEVQTTFSSSIKQHGSCSRITHAVTTLAYLLCGILVTSIYTPAVVVTNLANAEQETVYFAITNHYPTFIATGEEIVVFMPPTVTNATPYVIWTNILITNKMPFRLFGASKYATVITNPGSSANPTFQAYNQNTNLVELGFMELKGSPSGASQSSVAIGSTWTNTTAGTRFNSTNMALIHDIYMTNGADRGISILGWPLGSVVYNCEMHFNAGQIFSVNGLGDYLYGSYTNGFTNRMPAWDTRAFEIGSTNGFACFEDNFARFNTNVITTGGNGAMDSYGGAKWTYRYNTNVSTHTGNHGTDSGGGMRSTHTVEAYNNVITQEVAVAAFSFRGGTGDIYDNLIYTFAVNGGGARVDDYKSYGTNLSNSHLVAGYTNDMGFVSENYPSVGGPPYDPPGECCAPYGGTIDTSTGEFNAFSGGDAAYLGGPTYDQIGFTGPTTYGPTNTVQTARPMRFYNNTRVHVGTSTNEMGVIIPENGTNTGPYAKYGYVNARVQMGRDVKTNEVVSYTQLAYPHPLRTSSAWPIRTVEVASSPDGAEISVTHTIDNVTTAESSGGTPASLRYLDQGQQTFTAPASYLGGAFIKWQTNGVDYAVSQAITFTVTPNMEFAAVYTSDTRTTLKGRATVKGKAVLR